MLHIIYALSFAVFFLGINVSAADTCLKNINSPTLLLSYHSALCLTPNRENKVVLDACNNQINKNTVVIRPVLNPSGGFQLFFSELGKCAAIEGSGKTLAQNGAQLVIEACSQQDERQIFSFQNSIKDFLYFSIVSIASNKCLDISLQRRDKAAPVHQWSCNEGYTSQMFSNPALREKRLPIPKFMWTYWNTGEENMPNFYKANADMWKKRLGSDWTVVVLNNVRGTNGYFGNFVDPTSIPTEQTLKEKIGTGPEGQLGVRGKEKYYITFSDFVRAAVLKEHGGIYADPSVMIHSDLSEFTNILEFTSQFSVGGYTSEHQAKRSLRYADSLENFFLVAHPHSKLLDTWFSNFKNYVDLRSPGADANDHPMFSGAMGLKEDFSTSFKELRNYLVPYVALRYTLIKNPDLVSKIFIRSDVHLKDKGAFSLIEQSNWDDGTTLLKLSPNDIQNVFNNLNDVSISKFPSERSSAFIKFPYEFFFDPSNIFGRLNKF